MMHRIGQTSTCAFSVAIRTHRTPRGEEQRFGASEASISVFSVENVNAGRSFHSPSFLIPVRVRLMRRQGYDGEETACKLAFT